MCYVQTRGKEKNIRNFMHFLRHTEHNLNTCYMYICIVFWHIQETTEHHCIAV